MKIEDIRSEFRVIIVDDQYRRSTELCESLKEVGYQTQFYPTVESAIVAVRSEAPHVFILDYSKNEALSDKMISFLKKTSPETQIIIMVNETHLIGAIMKNSTGEIFDYLVVPFISTAELVTRVDRASHRLFLQFENEQLRKRRGIGSVVEAALDGLSFDETDSQEHLKKLQVHFGEMAAIREQEELIRKYIFQVSALCGSMPVLYLRFLPAQMSFVFGQGVWSPVRETESLGFRIESVDKTDLGKIENNPCHFAPLTSFISSVFQVEEFGSLLHFSGSQLKGLVVVLNKAIGAEHLAVRLCHEFFKIVYSKNELAIEFHSQQMRDPMSGLLNRKSFDEKLQEEVSRARRIQHPLSMIKIQIDNFDLLSQKYGEENLLLVVKALAKSMKKNFRNTDILARLAINEFCFLLPHTEIKHTLIKAEKVRRAFTQSQFPFVKIEDKTKLSLSIGVSEYPSLCKDAEGLSKSCDDALFQIKRNQGNRVGAWQADSGFRPDYLNQLIRSAE